MGYNEGCPDGTGRDASLALQEGPLSVDALLDILANTHRRHLVAFLRARPDHTASFEAAARHVAASVGDGQGAQPNHDDVHVELYHHHLPKLADAGIVEYDVRSRTIRYEPNERLEALFDRVEAFQDA